MFKSLKVRWAITAAVTLVSLYCLVPTLVPELPSNIGKFVVTDKIRLGLDLQGGMHMILEVDADKALETMMERTADDLKESLMDNKVRFRRLAKAQDATITMELTEAEGKAALEKILKEHHPELEIASSTVREGGQFVTLIYNEKRAADLKKLTVEHSVETIRNRIDQFGVAEPEIIPEGSIIAYGSRDDGSGARGKVPYLLKNKTLLTGASLETAKVQISDRFGEPHVSIKFNSQGAADFDRITNENVRKRLAIVLDGVVHSAPVIQERISGGQAQITGNFTMEEARDLAIVLRAGALPAPVNILEETTVGPSLGSDSIRQGVIAALIGFVLVIIFMAIYYRLSGLVADSVLILNIIVLLGILAGFKATLTLPGIAGIVLVIGMAVDANVLIFERVREELRIGKTPSAAIDAGYGKAFITILDANITTLIAALFLFAFGTGPIKGFALTLSIGIVVSMFTAIFVTRAIFDYFLWNKGIKKISI